MDKPHTLGPASGDFHRFLESGETPEREAAAPRVEALQGIRASPFKDPYPVQKPGGSPSSGYAGELRGYYRRSDGNDRWKPSWSRFGHPRNGATHRGDDIYARVGTAVVAIADGYAMLYPDPAPGDDLGIKVGITFTGSDNRKYDVLYGHLSAVVGVSRQVRKGDLIGYTGCTGNADDNACTVPNRCNGYSSHLHIAVRESVSGAAYLDPSTLFGWALDYEHDTRDVPCGQAFSQHLILEVSPAPTSQTEPPEEAVLAAGASQSRKFRLRSSTTKLNSGRSTSLAIYEDLEISLTLINSAIWPGVVIEISGRERHFFHPTPSRDSTHTITASLQNLGPNGGPVGDAIDVRLTRIENETASDTGLRTLYVREFARDQKLDLELPIQFIGVVLELA
ncbi:M23 family metallopeptidase [Paucibacter sp. B2R-40]|uniref:M23 family metallopeptidase n=1 Tax=Paucibacter sp. B2R-40 TaxID=2893554 RepID=UPI0021E4EA6B|nr:M23 family metallopeptidase [Paucibacter sp. B2R-40]MCV2354003.1 M23 family metallopeptidase [Paucibacter sp. B2R-40]